MSNGEFSFPTLGRRSPILKIATSYLRRAYYITNAIILLVLLIVFGYVKYKEWRYERDMANGMVGGKKVIKITYAQLGPPPSITGEDAVSQSAAKPAAPTIGVPKPVPDAEAAQETAPTQQEMASNAITDTGRGLIVEGIPDINAFIPCQVYPKETSPLTCTYPEVARRIGVEGTVFIKMLIDLDGSIMRVVILKGSGSDILDTTAVENAYNKWKFTPAIQNNKPVRVWVMYPVKFTLKEE